MQSKAPVLMEAIQPSMDKSSDYKRNAEAQQIKALFDVEKTRHLVNAIMSALTAKDKKQIFAALLAFSIYVRTTLDQQYKGKGAAEYAAMLVIALGDDFQGYTIPEAKLFNGMYEAIVHVMQASGDADAMTHFALGDIYNMKNGAFFFQSLLKNRGTSARAEFDDEHENIFAVSKSILIKQLMHFQLANAYSIIQRELGKQFEDRIANKAEEIFQRNLKAASIDESKLAANKHKSVRKNTNLLSETKNNEAIKYERKVQRAKSEAIALAKFEIQDEILDAKKLIAQRYIRAIRRYIEATDWKVKKNLFSRQTITIPGHPPQTKVVPRNIAKFYAECLRVEITKDWILHFNEIVTIGIEASKPHRLDFFGTRKRDEEAQHLYTSFKEAKTNKESLSQLKKSPY